jgi:hypothetical protein
MSPLTVHNAAIHTATAEIKTLTVSGRQVTLAVYRQLRERPLISDEDGVSLNGTPWGVVEYHPDTTCPTEEHVHVIWSRGSDLFRSAVLLPGPPPTEFVEPRHGRRYLNARVREELLEDRSVISYDAAFVKVKVGTYVARVSVTEEMRTAADARRTLNELADRIETVGQEYFESASLDILPPHRGKRGIERLSVTAPAALRFYWYQLDEALAPLGNEPLESAYVCLAAELDEGIRQWEAKSAVSRRLAELPQLFIAA